MRSSRNVFLLIVGVGARIARRLLLAAVFLAQRIGLAHLIKVCTSDTAKLYCRLNLDRLGDGG